MSGFVAVRSISPFLIIGESGWPKSSSKSMECDCNRINDDLTPPARASDQGGNVVLYSMRDTARQEKVAAIIALGSPFIHISARELQGVDTLIAIPAALVLLSVGTVVLMGYLMGPCIYLIDRLPESLAALAFAPVLIGFLFSSKLVDWLIPQFLRLNKAVETWLAEKQQKRVDRLATPIPLTVPLLHLSSKEDEAFNYLSSLGLTAELPFKLWAFTGRFGVLWIVLPPTFLTGFFASMFALDTKYEVIPTSCLFLFLASLTLPMAALIGQPLLMSIIPRIIRAPGHAFGGESIADNLLCRIEVTNAPECAESFRLEYVDIAGARPALRKGLNFLTLAEASRHCRLYSELSTFTLIKQWLRDTGFGSNRV